MVRHTAGAGPARAQGGVSAPSVPVPACRIVYFSPLSLSNDPLLEDLNHAAPDFPYSIITTATFEGLRGVPADLLLFVLDMTNRHTLLMWQRFVQSTDVTLLAEERVAVITINVQRVEDYAFDPEEAQSNFQRFSVPTYHTNIFDERERLDLVNRIMLRAKLTAGLHVDPLFPHHTDSGILCQSLSRSLAATYHT